MGRTAIICLQTDFIQAQFAEKEDFSRVLSVVQGIRALLIFGKCANKLDIGGVASPDPL